MRTIETELTKMMGCQVPIVAAPMFLVSNADLVVEASEAGGIGAFPSLNFRPIEEYKKALTSIKSRTQRPICVNIIVNKSNTRVSEDLKYALNAGVEMFITSLGSPRQVIQEAHRNGAKVFCDVTNLQHALKVQDMGADGVIAVSSGAGGHAGPISPMVLIPWLKTKLKIPILAAGGIANGSQMAAALALGAAGVSVGTRFIASKEAQVTEAYKQAVLSASPEDIVMTTRVSGTPAAVIKTPYVEKVGLDLPWYMKTLKNNPWAKKYVVSALHLMGARALEKAAVGPTWKTVWSAGQSVGLINDVKSTKEIIEAFVKEYEKVRRSLP